MSKSADAPSASSGYVVLTLVFEREGRKWVGTCEEMGTSTYARTLAQCRRELEALVADHLNLLEEEGERENFFEKWGIAVYPIRLPRREFDIHVSAETGDRLLKRPDAPSSPPFLLSMSFPLPAGRRAPKQALATL